MSQNRTLLLGLDFGSTTCSALIVSAAMTSDGITGTAKFSAPHIIYRATPVFTPFVGDNIDAEKVTALIQKWLLESKLKITELFSASAIITGLAAQQANVETIRELIAKQIPNAAIVAAGDPHLESWLAFMGSCATLSRYYAESSILNLDIGGGTTNSAIGVNGNVSATGSHYIGARHFQFAPGSYQLLDVSQYALALLHAFEIKKDVGDTLTANECKRIIKFYIQALEAIVLNDKDFFDKSIANLHVQATANTPYCASKITFSGGVGELVYQLANGDPVPGTTFYGDFGIDIAKAIVASPVLSTHLKTHKPENLGRATVYGLALNSTEISGSSVYLPNPDLLPLNDIPILAKLPIDAPTKAWQEVLLRASTHANGACLQITQANINLRQIRDFSQMFSKEIAAIQLKKPIILLVEGNMGKTLGNYITNWGKLGIQLVVIDEIVTRDAHFVNLGKVRQGVVPVSFYGMY
jgi:ethanolamine utilization protein EutA